MPDLAAILRRVADETEQQEKGESTKQLEDRVAALEQQPARDVREALSQLSDEDLAALADRLRGPLGVAARQEEDRREEDTSDAHEGGGDDAPPPDPPARRTRPGRRKGKLYHYRTDEKGRVIESAVPVVYTGDDEPDEVDLPGDDDGGDE